MCSQSATNRRDAEPVQKYVSRVSNHMIGESNEMIDEMVEAGLIIKSKSVMCSLSTLSLRLCMDCRELNKIVVRESFERPSFGAILNKLSN